MCVEDKEVGGGGGGGGERERERRCKGVDFDNILNILLAVGEVVV